MIERACTIEANGALTDAVFRVGRREGFNFRIGGEFSVVDARRYPSYEVAPNGFVHMTIEEPDSAILFDTSIGDTTERVRRVAAEFREVREWRCPSFLPSDMITTEVGTGPARAPLAVLLWKHWWAPPALTLSRPDEFADWILVCLDEWMMAGSP